MSSKTPTLATCGLCSQLYTDPRMLQCLHTFCSKCLKKILGEQRLGTSLKCPTCKKPTTIPKGSVTALPKDLRKSYEAEVAQIASKMQSKEEISCDQCVDPSSGPAVSFCVNCCDFLCNACAKHHKTWRKTLNHELVGSSKVGPNVAAKSLGNIPHKPMNCQLHEDETLKFYCETCGTLICRDCMAIEHAGHKYDRIEKVAEKEKVHLVSLLRNADDAKAKLDGAITSAGKVVQQVQAKQKVVEKDIKIAFKALTKALLSREQSLLEKAGEISLGKQTALTMQEEELKALRKEIIETSEMITAATKVYTPAEMLSSKGAMANKLEQLLKQYRVVSLEPCRSDMIPSVLSTTETVKSISSFGIVAGGSFPGEAKIDLRVPRAIIAKKRKIAVTACDISGKKFPYGGEKVEATLCLLGSQYPPIIAQAIDRKNGTYVISFTPQKIGEHELRITIDGNHIKGSPFSMYVRQERNYTSLSSQQCFSLSGCPYDVAVEDGKVYVAVTVYECNCIEVFDQNGQRICTIGNTGRVGLGGGFRNTAYADYGYDELGGLDNAFTGELGYGGSGNAVSANVQLCSPSALAVQGGVLYVVESSTCRVQKLTTGGKFLSSFGTRGSGNGQLSNPRGICLDNEGRVFISECGNNRVSVFEANGTFLHHITGNTVNGSNLNGPWGLAFDQSGNLHVADTNTSQIKVFTPQGQYVNQYNSGVSQPAGIAIDDEGNVFISDSGCIGSLPTFGPGAGVPAIQMGGYHLRGQVPQPNQVCVLNSKHNIIHSFGTNQDGAGITIDKEGFIYVCSFNNYQVHKY